MENFRQFWSYSTVVFSQNLPEAISQGASSIESAPTPLSKNVY